MSDYLDLDACGQATAIQDGLVSARELAEAAITRIEAVNPELNALSWERFERALEECDRLDPAAPFAGVPILLKDHRCTAAGQETRYGTTALATTQVPGTTDSNIYRAIVDAGFVVLGRTTVPEFATAFVTESQACGITRNPRALNRTPGGSSGGAAAAVAAGMVAVAHATDGGGSIRQPASACGLVGLKPSRGRVSLGPDAGESWAGATVEGVIVRTVRDAAAVTSALARHFPGDPYSVAGQPLQSTPGQIKPQRIGVMRHRPSGEPWPSTEVATVVDEIANALADRGHQVSDGFPAALTEADYPVHYDRIVDVDVELLSRRVESQLGRPLADRELAPRNADKRARAQVLGAPAYLESRYWLATWTYRLASWWSDFDVLMTPTMGDLPALVGTGGTEAEFDASIVARSAEMTVMTNFANIGGLPAISVPLGRTASGIPIGIQFVGRHGAEDTLLGLAMDFEANGPWPTY
ncbi:amidase [Mycolicibacterium sp. jd]|uniref:amidase n=1 Tax=unclassified Mycolicibacterium TaxID=2636767 RepID=UPI00351B086E